MAEDQLYELRAKICRALAHPRRLKIVDCLREGEKCVAVDFRPGYAAKPSVFIRDGLEIKIVKHGCASLADLALFSETLLTCFAHTRKNCVFSKRQDPDMMMGLQYDLGLKAGVVMRFFEK